MKEIWKEVFDYEGLYWVSNKGRVKSKRKLRKISTKKDGYLYVSLSKKGIVKTFLVHRLVAITFIQKTHKKTEVNHIDGDKTNNHVSNLEWVTSSENTKHAYMIGLQKSHHVKGEKNHFNKLKKTEVINIKKEILNGSKKLKQIAFEYNVSPSIISDIKRGKRWAWLS